MASLGRVARVTLVTSLIISLSGVGVYPCLVTAPRAVAASLGDANPGCCCCQGTCACGMACSSQQTPRGDERQAPQRSDRGQTQLVMMLVPLAGVLSADAGGSADIAALFSELQSRLARPTLQSQHICMQV